MFRSAASFLQCQGAGGKAESAQLRSMFAVPYPLRLQRPVSSRPNDSSTSVLRCMGTYGKKHSWQMLQDMAKTPTKQEDEGILYV